MKRMIEASPATRKFLVNVSKVLQTIANQKNFRTGDHVTLNPLLDKYSPLLYDFEDALCNLEEYEPFEYDSVKPKISELHVMKKELSKYRSALLPLLGDSPSHNIISNTLLMLEQLPLSHPHESFLEDDKEEEQMPSTLNNGTTNIAMTTTAIATITTNLGEKNLSKTEDKEVKTKDATRKLKLGFGKGLLSKGTSIPHVKELKSSVCTRIS
eukprot:TRINITY_DN11500_c0_g2_i2.p1 TRINITY_DN11500_c0_g2~~TRINITY_DN11500_c0_g2_i2.p1  ORF type:complete len:212 (-),score=39.62 TRINITY_DN11500_c0_g2_i2:93-728(-)